MNLFPIIPMKYNSFPVVIFGLDPYYSPYDFQTPATPIAEGIIRFHHDLMVILTFICFFVLWMLMRTAQLHIYPDKKDLVLTRFKRGFSTFKNSSKTDFPVPLSDAIKAVDELPEEFLIDFEGEEKQDWTYCESPEVDDYYSSDEDSPPYCDDSEFDEWSWPAPEADCDSIEPNSDAPECDSIESNPDFVDEDYSSDQESGLFLDLEEPKNQNPQ